MKPMFAQSLDVCTSFGREFREAVAQAPGDATIGPKSKRHRIDPHPTPKMSSKALTVNRWASCGDAHAAFPSLTRLRGIPPIRVMPPTPGLRNFSERLICPLERLFPDARLDPDASVSQLMRPTSIADNHKTDSPFGEVPVSHHPVHPPTLRHPCDMAGGVAVALRLRH